jgi:hypothetical protein
MLAVGGLEDLLQATSRVGQLLPVIHRFSEQTQVNIRRLEVEKGKGRYSLLMWLWLGVEGGVVAVTSPCLSPGANGRRRADGLCFVD